MKEKIKELFAMLPRTEQLELLRELTSNVTIQNPVIKVNEISQVQFRQNIVFNVINIGSDGNPSIKVELTTPWGTFEATATNQKIAKAMAAEKAILSIDEKTSPVSS